ncbi:uncharacterized protein LOC106873827 [Octopus bimaculoides]|uniref:Uncharacterized protein n=1 Tax=Octopus bimaculoides TaxID=37653 RepID=A0A0L8GZ76_OCTBM|nr:uncharacterized protein LOC106873827 [Octopus bimaculoides]|eukprot:XP_014776822.1 PREDICTED: uncharacterized protein LOC106873827 [Octopus bimaculoides]
MMMNEQQPLLGEITPSFSSSSSSSVRNRGKAGAESQQQQQEQREEKLNIDNVYPHYAKVCLARCKKPDPWYIKLFEVILFVGAVSFSLYCYMFFDNVHFHTLNAYAHLGYSEAQHLVGQRYLNGIGTEKHPEKAMMWFNDAHSLIADAARKGLSEANETLKHVCSRGGCNR